MSPQVSVFIFGVVISVVHRGSLIFMIRDVLSAYSWIRIAYFYVFDQYKQCVWKLIIISVFDAFI